MKKPAAKLFASGLILGLCATYGCSGDDDDNDTSGSSAAKGGKGGSGAKGGSAGKGGTAGRGGSGALGGTGGRGGNGGTVFGGVGGTSGRGGNGGTVFGGVGGTAGTTLGGEGGNSEAGAGAQAGLGGESGATALRERGKYLVDHVAACGDCHTPRSSDGSPDMTRYLAGNATFIDLVPDDDTIGLIPSRNLTPDASGLGDWTDAQIKAAFLNGVDDEGEPLFPVMPYYVFHNMTTGDADAIVAYLRSVAAVQSNLPERQPLPIPLAEPASPIPAASIPDTTLAASSADHDRALNGRYLAGMIGTCMECHTAEAAPSSAIPIDVDRLFAGGRVFDAAALGLPVPPFPAEIVTPNLTPDGTGILTLSVDDLTRAIRQGIDEDGTRLCPPMPAGPMMAFGGMTLEDATDIAIYLKSIAPLVNAGLAECTPPEEGGGGASGAGGNGTAP